MSLRDKILACDDIQRELVEIPEWGVILEVRGMNGADRSRIIEMVSDEQGNVSVGTMYVETVIASTYDPESGERVFSPTDRDALTAKAASAIDRIAKVGMRLSRMDGEATEEAKRQFPEASSS